MMKVRKVMQLGRSSLVVSLPSEWVKQYKLKKKDELVFETRGDGSLGIYPRDSRREHTSKIMITIDRNTDEGMVERQLIAAYLMNFREIELKSTDIFTSAQQEELRNRLKELVGLQRIETSSKLVRIQSIVNVSDFAPSIASFEITISISMFKKSTLSSQPKLVQPD